MSVKRKVRSTLRIVSMSSNRCQFMYTRSFGKTPFDFKTWFKSNESLHASASSTTAKRPAILFRRYKPSISAVTPSRLARPLRNSLHLSPLRFSNIGNLDPGFASSKCEILNDSMLFLYCIGIEPVWPWSIAAITASDEQAARPTPSDVPDRTPRSSSPSRPVCRSASSTDGRGRAAPGCRGDLHPSRAGA
jgi:hypothetical protein